jgi:succinoglycan biosynthesis transport protein ExoP
MRDLLRMFRRRFSLIRVSVAAALLAGALVCIFSTRRYEATGTIQLQRESTDGLSRDSLMGSAPLSSDALGESMTIQTQTRILQSDVLALRTIRALKLEDSPEFILKPGMLSWWHTLTSRTSTSKEGSSSNASTRQKQAEALKVFRHNLTVEAVGGSRIIEISFTNGDPELAASILNQLVQELVEYNFETGYKATEAASEALSKQLVDLRLQSEELQAKVATMQRQSGIYSIGTTDAEGRQQAYSAVLEQFERASTTLSDAAQTRILKEAIYHAAQAGDAETLSSLAGNTIVGAAPSGITNSLATIQNLRSQEGTLQGALDQLKAKFDVGYPKVAELQANIDSLERSIKQEVDRITKRARNDYLVADRTWKNALDTYKEQKVQADALNNRAIQYMITRQEADDSRILYEDLLKRLKEAGILQGLKSNNISVVDQALVPTKPKKPNVPVYLGAALGLGLLVGAFAVVFVESLDDKVWDSEAVEQMGLSVAGMVPNYQEQGKEVDVTDSPHSRYGDAVRSLRFDLMRSMSGGSAKLILVTCATPDERKDELCMDLAESFAQAGRRVLLVESDMRSPALLRNMGLPGNEGLSKVLSGLNADRAIINHPRVPHLFVLPAGASPQNPSELVESQRMQKLLQEWREAYDFVVVNAPPVIRFTDARYLSEFADLTLQVAQYGATTRTSLLRAHSLLSSHANGNIETVLVGVPQNSASYRN